MKLKFLFSHGTIGIKKTVVPMKIFLLNAILCFLCSSYIYSQNISLSLSNAPLEKAFKEIKRQSGYNFIYTREQIKKANPVSIHLKSASIKQALDNCFKSQPLTYVIDEKYIIIKEKPPQQKPSGSSPINTPEVKAEIHLSGKVVNDKGEPIAGATVTIIGSRKAVATNENGEFLFDGVESDVTIEVTSIGYESVKIKPDGKNHLLITMATAVSSLDETIVIAYGTTTRRLNTGSVSKISKEEIERQPVINPLSAIQGRMPGVFVNTENGIPGGNIKVQIRGRGSINAGTDPLYIIDGVPFISEPLNYSFSILSTGIAGATSPLNSINPNDIESIEALKDADATAIYGSRAANGVVLITTKKGMAGKTKVSINFSSGISTLASFPKLLNLQQYLELRREGFKNDSIKPTVINAPDLLVWDTTKSTNWPRYLLGGKAQATSAQVSVSGGNELTNFLFSANGRKEGTMLPGDQQYERGGFNFNFRHATANKKFLIEFSSNFSTDNNKSLPSSIFSILTLPPNIPIYDKEGNYNWNGMADINPASILLQKSISRTDNLLSNLNLTYKITPDIECRTSFGINKIQMDQVMTYPLLSLNPAYGQTSYAQYGNNKSASIIVEPLIEYYKGFKRSGLKILLGSSWQQSTREGTYLYGTNYSNDLLLEYQGAAGIISATNLYSLYKYVSLFGRVHYDYLSKYIINISGRRDGSSRFGTQNQYGNFASLGGAWLFNKEALFEKFGFISYGKIRASYGFTGNDQIRDYQYLSTYGISGNYQDVVGMASTRIANADFGWESNRKFETAIELGLLKDRILLSVAWFNNQSGNQLIDYPLPYISGPFGSYQANLPALIENKGWEIGLNTTAIKNDKISLTFSGNISIPKNKLLKYPGIEASAFSNTYVIGEDINIQKAIHFLGINPKTGLPEYEDINKDGLINTPADYTIVGKRSPFYYGGFGTNIRCYQFQVDFFFQFSKQFAQGLSIIPGRRPNSFEMAMNRWQNPDDLTVIPKATTGNSTPYSILSRSDFAFYNASYMRLKNVSISYNIPKLLLEKVKVYETKIFIEAQNLFTWNKKGAFYDPETANLGIAPLKTIIAGFKITL